MLSTKTSQLEPIQINKQKQIYLVKVLEPDKNNKKSTKQ
jgi:hypothetical protein